MGSHSHIHWVASVAWVEIYVEVEALDADSGLSGEVNLHLPSDLEIILEPHRHRCACQVGQSLLFAKDPRDANRESDGT
jgi:hypothetical protein